MRQHDATYNAGFTYRGNVTRSVSPGAIKNIFYDTGGNATSANDNNGHTVSSAISYATNYAAPDRITPNSTTQLSSSFTYTSFLGLSTVTGPNSATASSSYDSVGRLTSSASPHGAVTYYSYAYNPTVVTSTTNARIVKTYLDGLGRTIKVETGDSSGVKLVTETEYDACACSPLHFAQHDARRPRPVGRRLRGTLSSLGSSSGSRHRWLS